MKPLDRKLDIASDYPGELMTDPHCTFLTLEIWNITGVQCCQSTAGCCNVIMMSYSNEIYLLWIFYKSLSDSPGTIRVFTIPPSHCEGVTSVGGGQLGCQDTELQSREFPLSVMWCVISLQVYSDKIEWVETEQWGMSISAEVVTPVSRNQLTRKTLSTTLTLSVITPLSVLRVSPPCEGTTNKIETFLPSRWTLKLHDNKSLELLSELLI